MINSMLDCFGSVENKFLVEQRNPVTRAEWTMVQNTWVAVCFLEVKTRWKKKKNFKVKLAWKEKHPPRMYFTIFKILFALHINCIHLIFHWLRKMARLQQYVNRELPDVQAGFRKGRGTRDQIANVCWIIVKAIWFQKKHLLLLYWLH